MKIPKTAILTLRYGTPDSSFFLFIGMVHEKKKVGNHCPIMYVHVVKASCLRLVAVIDLSITINFVLTLTYICIF
jgi:hypothetical protein